MSELGNLYQVTHFQSLEGGESISNVYFFDKNNPVATAEDLADSFFEELLPTILACQSSKIVTERVQVINIGVLEDFVENVYSSIEGAWVTGGCLPIHSAINFSLRPNTRSVRPGSKRLSGIPETAQEAGIVNDPDYIANLEGFRVQVALALSMGASPNVFDPVIVKRVRVGSPGSYTYRLPETDLEYTFAYVTAALLNLHVSHQVSRGNSR